MKKHWRWTGFGFGLAAMAGVLAPAGDAQACGGFFCSANQPVNQAAERIVFADNGDGTVTAVIQILYQGEATKFSWLLPISTVPTGESLAVASNVSFQRLQSLTNPQYQLTTRVEGNCKLAPPSVGFGGASAATGGTSSSTPGGTPNGGVVVQASGTVGAFDWVTISVDSSLPDVADAAVNWLKDNGYTVGEGAPGLLRPYLADGLYLLALKLTKGSGTGSIRPLMLTYEAARPMIPIKLTAVAANENMGVMTWLLGAGRGVPQNYLSLELNDARINWFNPSINYNSVVTAAADEAGGQGFVTELAGKNALQDQLWTLNDGLQWDSYQNGDFASGDTWYLNAYYQWGQWDGFWDVMKGAIRLTPPLTLEELQACPTCSPGKVQLNGTAAALIDGLRTQVIEPVMNFQELFDAHAYVTRLYTTMSAAEMSVDPLFAFNSSLPAVSNVHQAERVIECSPEIFQSQASWRVELPQGVVRGSASQAASRVWPTFESQPSNTRILRLAPTGMGVVLEDNSEAIAEQLDAYSKTLTGGSTGTGGGGISSTTGGAGGNRASGGAAMTGKGGAATGMGGATDNPNGGEPSAGPVKAGGGCAIALAGEQGEWGLLVALGVAGIVRRRRNRRQ